ncbi:hypothetical protein SORBI_3008G090400 [Sorghum bicolor]|uniref:Uncharacterized protein n=1 Tax=Sorghum bicolor TaxID=4558 RepID=A0A1B6PCI9_SORBI|nr:hypothetical protein SORBI_3008G090400 [Sorghum bicolor]
MSRGTKTHLLYTHLQSVSVYHIAHHILSLCPIFLVLVYVHALARLFTSECLYGLWWAGGSGISNEY